MRTGMLTLLSLIGLLVLTTATRFAAPSTSAASALTGNLTFVDAAGGNLNTVNGDGTNLQKIGFGLDPQWSHDGTQIAVARQGPVPGIYVMNADGSNERLLYQTNEPRSPAWSPDDSQIVFSYQAPLKGGGEKCMTFRGQTHCMMTPETEQWRLATVDVATGKYTDVKATNNVRIQ